MIVPARIVVNGIEVVTKLHNNLYALVELYGGKIIRDQHVGDKCTPHVGIGVADLDIAEEFSVATLTLLEDYKGANVPKTYPLGRLACV